MRDGTELIQESVTMSKLPMEALLVALYHKTWKRQVYKQPKQLISAISLLFSTGEATSAVPGPVLGSPVKDRYGHTGENPAKGH